MGEMFLRAEQAGLKLAIIGRAVALVVLGLYLAWSRARDPAHALDYLILLSVFVALGLAHYSLIGTRFDKPWVKYAFITLDIAIVSALVATQPLYESAAGLPAVMLFRAPVFPFYFVILGIAAFSFSPGMVLWTGIAGALGWLAAFQHSASGVQNVRNWNDIPPDPTAEQVMAVVLDPNFGGLGGRIQEAVLLALVAFLMAVVMWRARTTLARQLEAERDRATLSGLFGRFVPQSVVNAMIAGHGALAPVEREATVLFADIAGFTGMTERAGAVRTVEVLNAYFDEVTRIIGAHNGIVTQFQGDAVLATFNVPVEDARARAQCLRGRARDPALRRGARVRRGAHPGAHRHQHGPSGCRQCRRRRAPELHGAWGCGEPRRPSRGALQGTRHLAPSIRQHREGAAPGRSSSPSGLSPCADSPSRWRSFRLAVDLSRLPQ